MENETWRIEPLRPGICATGARAKNPGTLMPSYRPDSLRSPGDPWAQYIRSGPEGARGVLEGRGWSLCMLLSALLFFRLPSFVGCLHVSCSSLPDLRDLRAKVVQTTFFRPFFHIVFWMVFSWFLHQFWMTCLMIFQCFLHHFFETFFSCFFEVFRIDV